MQVERRRALCMHRVFVNLLLLHHIGGARRDGSYPAESDVMNIWGRVADSTFDGYYKELEENSIVVLFFSWAYACLLVWSPAKVFEKKFKAARRVQPLLIMAIAC